MLLDESENITSETRLMEHHTVALWRDPPSPGSLSFSRCFWFFLFVWYSVALCLVSSGLAQATPGHLPNHKRALLEVHIGLGQRVRVVYTWPSAAKGRTCHG